MKTVWKTHPVFTNYEISNMGQVRSKSRIIIYPDGHSQHYQGRIIHPYNSTWGYLMVNITTTKTHKRIHKQVNDLVAETFIPNPMNLPETHHINYNKHDNKVTNLIWVSHKDNTTDKGKHYHQIFLKQHPQYTEIKKNKTHYSKYKCPLCNFPMNYKAALCKNCRQKYRKTHINGYYITPDNLIAILKYYNGNFTKTGYLFDVTGNAIVKYLKRYDLPYHRKDYQQTE